MKSVDPISVDLSEKLEILSLEFSFSSHAPYPSPPFFFYFPFSIFIFFFILFYFLFKFGYMAHTAPCVHLSFEYVSAPKQFIYFQFNLF